MGQLNTALTNAPSRQFFAPMFKARWQNAQNIVNDSAFYSMIPPKYKPYYEAYIRQWAEWSRGFVIQLHRQDFFSTGIGYTVCEIMAKECMTGGFRLHSADGTAKDFMESWADEIGLTQEFYRMFFDANAVGNCILALTPADKTLHLTSYPIDKVIFQIGRTKEITKAVLFNRFVAGEDSAYYVRETRVKLRGKPYYKVEISHSDMVTCPTFSNGATANVPKCIEEQWLEYYGGIKPNVWYKLPKRLRHLGLYNVPNKPVAVALKDMPGYSDSTLHTCLDILYSIDYNYTQQQVDMYMGKTRTLIPKQMQKIVSGQIGTLTAGQSFYDAINTTQPQLDDQFYTQVGDGLNGDIIKPLFIQPELREQSHKYIRDSDLELLASKIGLSASDLSNHLNYGKGGDKTATEVVSEGDTTEKTVNEKRALAKWAVNTMLSDVAYFYGYDAPIEVQWGRASVNTERQNRELLADFQAGTLSLRDYLRKRWTDLTEEDIEKKAVELEQLQEKRAMQEQNKYGGALFDEKDYYGSDTQ